MYEHRPKRIITAKKFCNRLKGAINTLKDMGEHPEEIVLLQKVHDYYYDLVTTYERLGKPPTILNQLYGKRYKDLTDRERKDYLAFLARNRRAKDR